ncbi:hypothetical protein EGW08_005378 [Elysia chlorotica]|uniref:Transmembrane protein n=1 Tax=Elysia chlorotica TaxID=188477 RepID=A0A3S1C9U2_ELYCH|nr:hypothetical protein EGW08_005378 [Elysia chlorotica]
MSDGSLRIMSITNYATTSRRMILLNQAHGEGRGINSTLQSAFKLFGASVAVSFFFISLCYSPTTLLILVFSFRFLSLFFPLSLSPSPLSAPLFFLCVLLFSKSIFLSPFCSKPCQYLPSYLFLLIERGWLYCSHLALCMHSHLLFSSVNVKHFLCTSQNILSFQIISLYFLEGASSLRPHNN